MPTIFYTFTGDQPPPGNPTYLSAAERARLPDERFAKRRADWLLGRWTAKHLLRAADPACAALPLTAISVENELNGAPFYRIAAAPDPYPACLSASHSRATALCALSFDLTIGADLEFIEPRSDAFAADYLTLAELRAARALPAPHRAAWVTLVWSAKEAVFKALRIGLRADTRAVEVTGAQTPPADGWGALQLRAALPGAENLRGWWREQDGFILTLAVRTASSEHEIRALPSAQKFPTPPSTTAPHQSTPPCR